MTRCISTIIITYIPVQKSMRFES